MSIRVRLVLLFSVCLLLAYACFGLLVFRASRDVAAKNFREMAIAQLQRVEERVNTFLEPGFMATEYLAETDLVRGSRDNLTSYLDTTENVTLLFARHPPYEQRVYNEFMHIMRYNRNFDLVFMANDDGQYAQAPEGRYKAAGYDPRRRLWYRELMASPDRSAVSSPYVTTGADVVCSIMTKTVDGAGRALGMVGVDYKLTTLTSDLRERRILKTGYLVVFDQRGSIIVDGHHPEFIGLNADEIAGGSDASDAVAGDRDLRKRLAEGADSEYEGVGARGFGEYAVSFTMARLGWKLAVIFERAEVLESSYQTLRDLFATAIPLFAATLLLTAFFAFRISQPIKKMTNLFSRLALGDITMDVRPEDQVRRDEIGMLARSMQEMIESSRNALAIADALAHGDYTHSMPLRSEADQLGRALDGMMKINMRVLTRIISLVDTVNRGAEIVSDSSRALTGGARTSAEALEQVSETITRVDRQASENAKSAQEANKFAGLGRGAAQRGYAAMADLNAAMAEFRKSGHRIRDVVKLIDEIAFQTNLLSLNAAVEAARAGRHGAGFSVVAEEVRSLAARSAKAAHETGGMVEAMLQHLEDGSQLAERSDKEFREIVDTVDQVARLFEHIAGASSNQSSSLSEVVQSLERIEVVIDDNNRHAEDLAGSADGLSRQADALRHLVSHFRVGSEGMGLDTKERIAGLLEPGDANP